MSSNNPNSNPIIIVSVTDTPVSRPTARGLSGNRPAIDDAPELFDFSQTEVRELSKRAHHWPLLLACVCVDRKKVV